MNIRKVRRSQVVSPFGVGAVVDLVGESFVAEDANNWRGRLDPVAFPRLAAYLEVPEFRTQPVGGRAPYYRFPQWLFCPNQKCRRMHRWSTSQEKQGAAPTCSHCGAGRKLVPMRFVAACGDGHLADIDWERWAHSEARTRDQHQCRVRPARLKFLSHAGVGSGLQSLEVRCEVCKAGRSLERLMGGEALRRIKQRCRGRQPWQVQQDETPCSAPLTVLQRGASSVYFPKVVSAIDIPPGSSYRERNDPANVLRGHRDFANLLERPDHPLREGLLSVIAADTGIPLHEVEAELAAHLGDPAPAGKVGDVGDIRPDEWQALTAPQEQHDPRDFFVSRRTPFPAPEGHGRLDRAAGLIDAKLDEVVLVDRLREVRVLRGFQRHTANETVPANLAHQPDFLPAVEVFGEGFFLRFREDAVKKWESQRAVQRRCAALARQMDDKKRQRWPDPTPRYVLLHTLAHLLLRYTAFDAGYSTSALQERLYCTAADGGPSMAGILVYTAAGDTEGTLGGLARMGEADRLVRLLCSAVAGAQWCSFDPVCGESPAQGPDGLSLAACHACTLVPETSCEAGNRLLDRRLVMDEELGFFATVADELGRVPGGGTW